VVAAVAEDEAAARGCPGFQDQVGLGQKIARVTGGRGLPEVADRLEGDAAGEAAADLLDAARAAAAGSTRRIRRR